MKQKAAIFSENKIQFLNSLPNKISNITVSFKINRIIKFADPRASIFSENKLKFPNFEEVATL